MPNKDTNSPPARSAMALSTNNLRLRVRPRSGKVRGTRADHSNKNYIPADVRDGLLQLRESGVATIRGVKFDLSSKLVLADGWKLPSRFASGQDDFSYGDPLLAFPWTDLDFLETTSLGLIPIQEGDEIYIHNAECKPYGSELDDPRDHLALELTLAFRRGDDVCIVEDTLDCFKPGSFHHTGMTYEAALGRLCEFVGIKPLDLNSLFEDRARIVTEVLRTLPAERLAASDRVAAWLAVKAAAFAGLGLDLPQARKFVESLKVQDVDPAALQQTMRDMFLAAANLATEIGYALAKSEFAPHLGDTLAGRKRRAVSLRTGRVRADAQIAKANLTWRADALLISKALRSKNSKWGQKALAKELVTQLKKRGKRPPDQDTVVRQIRIWEKTGHLERSSRYRAPSQGGER